MEFCEDGGIIRYSYDFKRLSLEMLKSERNSKEKVVKKSLRRSVNV